MGARKLKNEPQLLKEAIRAGVEYAERRGVVKFEPGDTQNEKVEYLYRLLVHDGIIQPLAPHQQNLANMRHKLALWIARSLPPDHPLMK
jgi:hypothetical protein